MNYVARRHALLWMALFIVGFYWIFLSANNPGAQASLQQPEVITKQAATPMATELAARIETLENSLAALDVSVSNLRNSAQQSDDFLLGATQVDDPLKEIKDQLIAAGLPENGQPPATMTMSSAEVELIAHSLADEFHSSAAAQYASIDSTNCSANICNMELRYEHTTPIAESDAILLKWLGSVPTGCGFELAYPDSSHEQNVREVIINCAAAG